MMRCMLVAHCRHVAMLGIHIGESTYAVLGMLVTLGIDVCGAGAHAGCVDTLLLVVASLLVGSICVDTMHADAGSVDAGRVNTYVAAGLLVSSSAGLVVVDRVRC
jgi:hypothetical protein